MDLSKFDAALRIHLSQSKADGITVSIRLKEPLNDSEKAQMNAIGLEGADTSKRVIFAALPVSSLESISQFDKVSQISLCQQMEPKDQEILKAPKTKQVRRDTRDD
jgi:hypothetical protein